MQRRSKLFVLVGSLALGCALAGCTSATPPASGAESGSGSSSARSADAEWTMPNKDTASTRYSSLSDINTDTVKNLKVAWTFSTGVLRGHEGGPLVVGSTMFVHTPYPNIVYALDLTKEGAPIKWKY